MKKLIVKHEKLLL